MTITRRDALLGLGTLLGTATLPVVTSRPARAQDGAIRQPSAVMELFTSQGCSACPAADEVLAAHADRDDVLALSWHVDYWDYLGWKDAMASPAFSARQRAYARNLGEGVYTPQLVVNGVVQGVGHRREEVANLLSSAMRIQPFVPLSVRRQGVGKEGTGYHVSLSADAQGAARAEDATLYLVSYDPERTVPIRGGENAGREMVYRNIVRGMQMLGSVVGGRLEVSLSLSALSRAMPGGRACALVLQKSIDGMPGPIVGAAVLGDVSGT